jgi:large subunit ribosomal protein L24
MKPLVYKKAKRVRHKAAVRQKLHIAKGDMVQHVYPRTGRVTIEGVNVVKRHRRQTQTTQGGIVEFPAPIHHSKAMLIDPKSGAPTRIRRRKDADGTLERIAVTSGQPILRNR